VKKAAMDGLTVPHPERFSSRPGRGIVCTVGEREVVVGNGLHLEEHGVRIVDANGSCNVHVAVDGLYLGGLEVADVVGVESKAAVQGLRSMGLQLVLLTGDSSEVARRVWGELGVETVRAELLPEQKMEEIRRLQSSGRRVHGR
jgi:P-type E1-E2 ATPase